VHDEFYLEVPEDAVEAAKKILVDVMQNCAFDAPALMSKVPLYVKPPKVGKTWADLI
jgi:DNA polymerase I-like protein with 3'-5' exonuclease and polymerase domains